MFHVTFNQFERTMNLAPRANDQSLLQSATDLATSSWPRIIQSNLVPNRKYSKFMVKSSFETEFNPLFDLNGLFSVK